jgi:cellulose synthase/poly-beta-1,6-N-acetylglucosamine synthase-like glycosyltransferase
LRQESDTADVLVEWFSNGYNTLRGMDALALCSLFLLPIILEIPRYILTFFPALVVIRQQMREDPGPVPDVGKVSILIPGHNEADSIEKCVLSLQEQTCRDFEIVCVSDGSTDETYAIMKRLQREGKVDKIAECAIRGGKSSAINLGMRLASGDIVIVIDCDCSFERTAIEELIRPFQDPKVGAVGGSVMVRNSDASITASLQAIEYMVAIQLGRTALDMFGQLGIISGAFGAFRRDAFMHVGMMDPGPGEDGDITMRLRLYDYKIAFAIRSIAYTDVPVHMFNLIKQRQRWERDALWTRYRKYVRIVNPFHRDFRLKELPHQLDYLMTDVVAGFIGVIYFVWLFGTTSVSFTLFMMFVLYLGLLVLDLTTFLCGVAATGRTQYLRLWPFIFIYGPFKGYFMRMARVYTYVEEWIWSASRNDNFAPPKVNNWIRWK